MSWLIRAAVAGALLHITPTVILEKRPEAATRLAPGADAFFAREVHLSDPDAHKLHEAVDWSPEDGLLTFYTGKRGANVVSAFLFVRVDTPHGPIEVAVGFDPAGAVRGVEITKATVETKPWVLEALRAGLTDAYRGLKPGQTPGGASRVRDKVGQLPAYIAGEIDKGVARALAAYGAFYR
ncbi:MAG: hypothetical protein E6H01_14550 [Bacillati bacterium ANGP1]|uniref:FMN-binding protein n=1 Tax=Candidatus Segetimicrobium genomatis TaxID=2569760 RepID=A0A537KHB7_9BACT|nr:MAG: hypothetical protein E6H01_14550 [Terrabacteria group bacterium ANGP1]